MPSEQGTYWSEAGLLLMGTIPHWAANRRNSHDVRNGHHLKVVNRPVAETYIVFEEIS